MGERVWFLAQGSRRYHRDSLSDVPPKTIDRMLAGDSSVCFEADCGYPSGTIDQRTSAWGATWQRERPPDDQCCKRCMRLDKERTDAHPPETR